MYFLMNVLNQAKFRKRLSVARETAMCYNTMRKRGYFMTKILFVCHGNICRSPMAEYVMKDLVKKAGLKEKIEIASAATSYEEQGSPAYPPVRRLLSRHGIDCSAHRARRLTPDDINKYDMLIGMDSANLRNMQRMYGNSPKISLLLDHTDHPRAVDDPWYSGDFEQTWQDINAGCKALLNKLKT